MLGGAFFQAAGERVGLYWNPWAVTGFVAGVLGWALAVVIYAARPGHLQNRSLALFMACIASGFGLGVGVMFASDDPTTSLALQAVSLVGFYASGPFYLLFLSTLPTRTMAWLRPWPVRALLWIAPVFAVVFVLTNFDRIVAGVIEVPYAQYDSVWTPFGTRVFEIQAIVTATLGIVAAIAVVVESPRGSIARKQAYWYAATFIVWDVLQSTAFIILEVAFRSATPRLDLYTLAAGIMFPATSLLFILMFAYAILKAHIFDIDLKLKWTLTQSTVAAAFVAVFFAVSEGAATFLGDTTGSTYAGIAATALLIFAFAPLQRLAARVTDSALPHVRDTAEYRLVRKREVYRAAVESALMDGGITTKERRVLATLADELGLTGREAFDVEAEASGPAAEGDAREPPPLA